MLLALQHRQRRYSFVFVRAIAVQLPHNGTARHSIIPRQAHCTCTLVQALRSELAPKRHDTPDNSKPRTSLSRGTLRIEQHSFRPFSIDLSKSRSCAKAFKLIIRSNYTVVRSPSVSQSIMGVSKLKSHMSIVLVFFPLVGAASVACFFEALSFLFIRPRSLIKHRQVCTFFSRCFFLISVFLLEDWANISFKAYGDRIKPDKSYLCVVNHRSDLDWLLGLAYVARLGYPYPGNAKSVVKASLAKVPIFGTLLRLAEFSFLTRSWATDKDKFLKALASLRTYSESGNPLWFVLYPEGTRFTKEKQAYSQAYAATKELRPTTHVLFPRYKAFTAIVSTLRGQFDGVIDATFMFEGEQPAIKGALAGTASTVVHVHTKSYPMEDLPEGEEQLEQWLLERWYEKDKRIAAFNEDVSTLGDPNEDLSESKNASARPFYALVAVYALAAIATIYVFSKFQNGLFFLFGASFGAVALTGLFTVLNIRPSRKGSGTAKKSR